MRSIYALSLSILFSACASGDPPTKAQTEEDVGILFPDAGNTNVDADTDSTIDPNNQPGPDWVVKVPGARKTIILEGMRLLPEGPSYGQILVADGFIRCIAADCTNDPDAETPTILVTTGVITPGLIDAHNHLPYNFLPEWNPGQRRFQNRYEWADDPSYEAHVAPYSNHRSSGSHFCPGARWGELRSLIHGTTTMQGQSLSQSCIHGMVRNADHIQDLQYDHMRTTISSPRGITDDEATGYLASFQTPLEPATRFAVHMMEGYAGNNVELEFGSFAGRDTRTNRHQGVSLLYPDTAILIHAIALTDAELDEVKATGAKIVWSPSSNIALYGRTLDIKKVVDLGITTGIGPDWTVSGEDDMLAELRYIKEFAKLTDIESTLPPKKLWEMATRDNAEVVGLAEFIGTLEVGKHADIAVFRGDADPYSAVVDSDARDVLLVMIEGEVYYGDAALQPTVARNDLCESITICGKTKFVCAAENATDEWATVPQIHQALFDILEGTGYPAEEQYKRGSELLELATCP